MTISMYQASMPVLIRSLNNLDHLLDKAAAFAEAKKIDPSVLAGWRLAADMFPLSRQVQIATDIAKGAGSRLAGEDPPKYEDTEKDLADLKARIAKTIAHLKSFDAARIDGAESRTVTLKVGGQDMSFSGLDYLMYFVLPNVHFHVTTTYALLRQIGVDIGKRDFLGEP